MNPIEQKPIDNSKISKEDQALLDAEFAKQEILAKKVEALNPIEQDYVLNFHHHEDLLLFLDSPLIVGTPVVSMDGLHCKVRLRWPKTPIECDSLETIGTWKAA